MQIESIATFSTINVKFIHDGLVLNTLSSYKHEKNIMPRRFHQKSRENKIKKMLEKLFDITKHTLNKLTTQKLSLLCSSLHIH